jgi:hypothetical protein
MAKIDEYRKHSFIVKVQQSGITNAPAMQMLVYNKNHDIEYQADLTPAVRKKLAGRPKAYFNAILRGTIIQINEEVPEQNW